MAVSAIPAPGTGPTRACHLKGHTTSPERSTTQSSTAGHKTEQRTPACVDRGGPLEVFG